MPTATNPNPYRSPAGRRAACRRWCRCRTARARRDPLPAEKPAEVGEDRRHVAVDGEGGGEPDHGQREHQPDLARCGTRESSVRRSVGSPPSAGSQASRPAMVSSPMPAMAASTSRQLVCWATHVPAGTPIDVGQRQPGDHQGDRLRRALGGDEPAGGDRADAEEGAVRQGGEHPRGGEGAVGGRERGEQVADDEDHHQGDERLAGGEAQAERGERGGADDDADGVGGDQDADGGHRDVEAVGDLGQHAHDDELGGADAEGADGEGEQGAGHEGELQGTRVAGGRAAGGPRRPAGAGLRGHSPRVQRPAGPGHARDRPWSCSHRGAGGRPPRAAGQGWSRTLTAPSFFSRKFA